MNRLTKLLVAVMLAQLFISCDSYLAKAPESEGLTQDEVFSDYQNFRGFLDNGYTNTFNYLLNFNQSMLGGLTDEGVMESEWETMPVIEGGDWLAAFSAGGAEEFQQTWFNTWEGIRIVNIAIDKIPELQATDTGSSLIEELKGQAHFLRAWFYYELLRRQGGMPYMTKAMEPTEYFGLERLSAYETALKIAADADTAMALLPDSWGASEIGRPTNGAAKALKASALLFGASPLNNPENSTDRWQAAAEASWDFIDFAETTGLYELMGGNSTDIARYMTPSGIEEMQYTSGRDSVFMYSEPAENSEIIWWHHSSITQSKYTTFGVPSLTPRSRVTGFSPSQNMVDRFETVNGLTIADDPDYDPQNPYAGRDPRFYQTILFNQRDWYQGANDPYLELYAGGRDRTGDKHYSTTGYLSNKYWAPYVNNITSSAPPITYTIYLRYADILLQYAEAANEVGGPNHAIAGADMTAAEAVNKVRARAGMPGVDNRYLTDRNTFRERIKNERAVELFFENKRLFDLQRWQDIDRTEHTMLYGANFEEDSSQPTGFSITRTNNPVRIRPYTARHYRIPVPFQDANMFEEFNQNPGW